MCARAYGSLCYPVALEQESQSVKEVDSVKQEDKPWISLTLSSLHFLLLTDWQKHTRTLKTLKRKVIEWATRTHFLAMNQADGEKCCFSSANAQVARTMSFDWAVFAHCTVTLKAERKKKSVPLYKNGCRFWGAGESLKWKDMNVRDEGLI